MNLLLKNMIHMTGVLNDDLINKGTPPSQMKLMACSFQIHPINNVYYEYCLTTCWMFGEWLTIQCVAVKCNLNVTDNNLYVGKVLERGKQPVSNVTHQNFSF